MLKLLLHMPDLCLCLRRGRFCWCVFCTTRTVCRPRATESLLCSCLMGNLECVTAICDCSRVTK